MSKLQLCEARLLALATLEMMLKEVIDRCCAVYEGSRVQELNLETFRFMHRLSYGHRNRKTLVVVIYDPTLPSCQEAEFEVGVGFFAGHCMQAACCAVRHH